MHGYQRKRIDVFLDPESDPLGAGYHIAQSKIAIGSGGIWGKGFLHGSQSHLDYLPEGHTDFVFATMAEEWGLVGGLCAHPRLRAGHPLGDEASAQRRQDRFAPPDRGRALRDDLLLRRDQPDDGDGPGAGRRHPPAARQLRRLGDDDRDAVPRHADVDRPQQPPQPAGAGLQQSGRGPARRLPACSAGPGGAPRDFFSRQHSKNSVALPGGRCQGLEVHKVRKVRTP